MPLTVDLALQQMQPILEELDDEHLDALISALAKRITAPQKKITILWGGSSGTALRTQRNRLHDHVGV